MKIEVLFGKPLKSIGSDVLLYMLSAQVDHGLAAASLCESGARQTDLREIEALKRDLLRLENGWRPSSSDLEGVPELQNWGILDTGDRLLKIIGDVVAASADGEAVANGKRVITGHILARDSALTWVRDRQGLYRLDEAPPEPRHRIAPLRRRRSAGSFQGSRNGRLDL